MNTYGFYETGEVPDLDDSHLLFMGGPMSVNGGREYPYLAEEKTLIRSAIANGSPVPGICLPSSSPRRWAAGSEDETPWNAVAARIIRGRRYTVCRG